jgi:hypothetical protein
MKNKFFITFLKFVFLLYLVSYTASLDNFLVQNEDLSRLILIKSFNTSTNNNKSQEIEHLKSASLQQTHVQTHSKFFFNNYRFLQSDNRLKILFLTDIHLDIYYDSDAGVQELQCKKAKGITIYNKDSAQKDPEFEFEIEKIKLKSNDYGKFKCDTNINLLKLILDKAKIEESKEPYDYIILLGDDISHNLNFDKKNMIKNYNATLKYINEELKSRFPTTTVLFTMGNNDFAERYVFPDKEKYNSQMLVIEKYLLNNINNLNYPSDTNLVTKTIKNSINSNINSKDSDYYNSWYSYSLNNNITALFINSILLNNRVDPATYSIEKINQLEKLIEKQFIFMEKELKQAVKDNKQVIINYHIPINNFYAVFSKDKMVNNVIEKHNVKFDDLIKQYRNNILCIFSGHLHYTSMSVRKSKPQDLNTNSNNNNDASLNVNNLKSKNLKKRRLPKNYNELINNYEPYVPTFSMPGVTPVSGSNPGFSIVSFENSSVSSITHYNFNLNSKQLVNLDNSEFSDRETLLETNFSKTNLKDEFKLADYSPKEVYGYLLSLLEKKDFQESYVKYLTGFHDVDSKGYLRVLSKMFDQTNFTDDFLREKYNELVCSSLTSLLNERSECLEMVSKFSNQ